MSGFTLKANKDLSPSGRASKFRQEESKLREAVLATLTATKALIESKIKDRERQISTPPPPEDELLKTSDAEDKEKIATALEEYLEDVTA